MQIPWEAIRWWEARRIVFNFILFLVGVLSIVVLYLVAPEITILSAPGAAGVILYGLAANVCYTIGWITEWAWSSGNTNLTRNVRPRIYNAGLIFSVLLTAAPAYLALILLIIKIIHHV